MLFFVMGVGLGLSFTGFNTAIVKIVDEKSIGIASSLFAMVTLIGNAMGVTMATILYEHSSLLSLLKRLQDLGYLLGFKEIKQLALYISSMGNGNSFSGSLQADITSNLSEALTSGVNMAMFVNFIVSLLVISICVTLLKSHTAIPKLELEHE